MTKTRQEIETFVKKELETIYKLIGVMQPKNEAEFINIMIPNLSTGLFHLLNETEND
tara:strand:+ start:6657 stop:6827 length:171 start_codon:yes stop_codon:yes gene_type:complete